jgi:DAD family
VGKLERRLCKAQGRLNPHGPSRLPRATTTASHQLPIILTILNSLRQPACSSHITLLSPTMAPRKRETTPAAVSPAAASASHSTTSAASAPLKKDTSSSSTTRHSTDAQAIVQNVWGNYVDKTPQRVKLIDAFMAFLVVVGGLQFVYCVIAGNYVCEASGLSPDEPWDNGS